MHRPVILKPIEGHQGDTFRELLDLWAERGFCELVSTTSIYCWLHAEGDVLLYDADRYDHLPPQWNIGLFGNPPPYLPRSYRWTYFTRRPRLVEEARAEGLPEYTDRPIASIFLGRTENPVQDRSRNLVSTDWKNYIEHYACPTFDGTIPKYPFTQAEYLQKVKEARFGLSLPGYGKKCNRDVELLAMGTVPIVTPGVDTSLYHEPLKEGVHFVRADRPEDIPRVIESIDEDEWRYLSWNGRQWFDRNGSAEASWQLTVKILSQVQAGR